MKKLLSSLVLISLAAASLFEAATAAFEETVSVAGTSFTVGTEVGGNVDSNTALKFLVDVGGAVEASNFADTINGPEFGNIDNLWTESVSIKIHNKGELPLDLISKSNYVNDPDVLRDDIFVEVLAWDDINGDGAFDTGEEGTSYGHDTILRWRNDTFPLGEILGSETKGFVLKFDGSGITDANFGQTAVYDFIFTGVEQTT